MEAYIASVEKNRQLILDAADHIWKNPEIGYTEWKTHAYLADGFHRLGYTLTEAGNIPGFTAELDTGRPGPTVLVFGEMDGLRVPSHPNCDPQTGVVHACGHCAQAAALLGLAAALREPGVTDGLSGKIRLVAVPSEEGGDMILRKKLKDEGVIRFYNGKPEFLRRGLLDGGDMAFMIHAAVGKLHTGSMLGGSNGLISKNIRFEGVAAHAGGAPHKGVNALYAANLALNAINALRETFQDDDHIRVHPIMTNGGDSVNAIPDQAELLSYVRGATLEKIVEANRKVDRALAGAAAAMGAKVHVTDIPGSMPRRYDPGLTEVFCQAMDTVLEEFHHRPYVWGSGCSDLGDISSLMPVVHPFIKGASGKEHGNDYRVDPEVCMDMAKVYVVALRLLLEHDAARARDIAAHYDPVFKNREEFMAFKQSMEKDRALVTYCPDGRIVME